MGAPPPDERHLTSRLYDGTLVRTSFTSGRWSAAAALAHAAEHRDRVRMYLRLAGMERLRSPAALSPSSAAMLREAGLHDAEGPGRALTRQEWLAERGRVVRRAL